MKTVIFLTLMLGIAACGTRGPNELPPGNDPDAGAWDGGTPCTAQSCAGCCDGNKCRMGIEESACGNGGVACVACDDQSLCGMDSRRCEPLDPNRYASRWDGGDAGPQTLIERCVYSWGKRVCF